MRKGSSYIGQIFTLVLDPYEQPFEKMTNNSSSDKPYVCNFCGKIWSKNYKLKRHKRQVHPQINSDLDAENITSEPYEKVTNTSSIDKPHICNICSKRWSTNSRLKRHKRQVHSKITNYLNKENSEIEPQIILGDLSDEERLPIKQENVETSLE